MSDTLHVTLRINGAAYPCDVAPQEKLLNTLRDLGFMSVKFGCGEGTCGSCMVLIDGHPRLACITFTAQLADAEITTLEGLADGEELHPLQDAFIEEGAIQCGYCTPGMILAAKALLDRIPHPTQEDIRNGLDGNRCRCTGYDSIFTAIRKVAKK